VNDSERYVAMSRYICSAAVVETGLYTVTTHATFAIDASGCHDVGTSVTLDFTELSADDDYASSCEIRTSAADVGRRRVVR